MKQQNGMMLIEIVISMLLLSIALLALVGMKATSITLAGDAKLRSDANYLASQLIGQMWVDRANLGSYAHRPTTGSACAFSGAESSLAAVTTWIGDSTKKGTVAGVLPNARAQILANASTGEVTVTLCWRAPQESVDHTYSTTTLISG
jgi:type IV pilus assembly protein PilV